MNLLLANVGFPLKCALVYYLSMGHSFGEEGDYLKIQNQQFLFTWSNIRLGYPGEIIKVQLDTEVLVKVPETISHRRRSHTSLGGWVWSRLFNAGVFNTNLPPLDELVRGPNTIGAGLYFSEDFVSSSSHGNTLVILRAVSGGHAVDIKTDLDRRRPDIFQSLIQSDVQAIRYPFHGWHSYTALVVRDEGIFDRSESYVLERPVGVMGEDGKPWQEQIQTYTVPSESLFSEGLVKLVHHHIEYIEAIDFVTSAIMASLGNQPLTRIPFEESWKIFKEHFLSPKNKKEYSQRLYHVLPENLKFNELQEMLQENSNFYRENMSPDNLSRDELIAGFNHLLCKAFNPFHQIVSNLSAEQRNRRTTVNNAIMALYAKLGAYSVTTAPSGKDFFDALVAFSFQRYENKYKSILKVAYATRDLTKQGFGNWEVDRSKNSEFN